MIGLGAGLLGGWLLGLAHRKQWMAEAAAQLGVVALPLGCVAYSILSLTLVRVVPVAIALWGTGLSRASVLFMGWFGPRGLASIVLGLVYLDGQTALPGEETVKLVVMADLA